MLTNRLRDMDKHSWLTFRGDANRRQNYLDNGPRHTIVSDVMDSTHKDKKKLFFFFFCYDKKVGWIFISLYLHRGYGFYFPLFPASSAEFVGSNRLENAKTAPCAGFNGQVHLAGHVRLEGSVCGQGRFYGGNGVCSIITEYF